MHRDARPEKTGALYVVATPIGNLGDLSRRALEILQSVDVVAAEDTRNTGQMLAHLGIAAKLTAVHEHNERAASERLIELMREGERVALVSDAGTPGISDPGRHLVNAAHRAGIPVSPIPGPNAAIAAMSVAGLEEGRFLFWGFLPSSPGDRRKALETVKSLPYALVFYEAPHRVEACVEDLLAVFGGDRTLVIAREVTKLFESIHVLPLVEAPAWLAEDANRRRGEFVLVVSPGVADLQPITEIGRRALAALLPVVPLKQAVRLAAEISGDKRNALYDLALALKQDGAT